MRTVEIQGGISRDHLVTVGRPAVYGQPGGPGLYAALGALRGAALHDTRTGATTRIRLRAPLPTGDIREQLTSAGVALPPPTDGFVPTLWILNAPEGRRVLSTAPHTHELDDQELVVRDSQPGTTDADTDILLRSAPGAGLDDTARPAIVLVDPDQLAIAEHGWDYLSDLASTTDVFLPSRVQLRQLHADPRQAAQELRRRTSCSVVARLDTEGSLVLPASGGTWRVSGDDVEVVDTTGAGDSHAGALAAALGDAVDGHTLIAATAVATAVVARTLTGSGAAELMSGPDLTLADLSTITVHQED